jgi:hypothetical protein
MAPVCDELATGVGDGGDVKTVAFGTENPIGRLMGRNFSPGATWFITVSAVSVVVVRIIVST